MQEEEKSNRLNSPHQIVKGTSLTQDAWRRLNKNKMAMTGIVLVGLYILIALLAPILPIYSYRKIILDHANLPPSLQKAEVLAYEAENKRLQGIALRQGRNTLNEEETEKLAEFAARGRSKMVLVRGKEIPIGDRRYFLGTDYQGRDMLARIIYGGRISITIGFLGAIVSVLVGVVVGATSGFIGGKVDYLITRVIDVLYGLPYMFIVIVLMSLLGRNVLNLFIAIALISWLTVARVVRGQVIGIKNEEFVEAARSVGAGSGYIIFHHLIPNTIGIVIIFTTINIPGFIMMEAFLSFLGLGVSAPLASWGTLIKDAVDGMENYPWRLLFPAIIMSLFLFYMNFVGDGLRDAFDPQCKNRL